MSLLSLSFPVLALAINAPAQRFKLPFRAIRKTTLSELCKGKPFLSHLWRPSSSLQELKGKAGPPSTSNVSVISLELLAPKKCLIPTSSLAEEGIGCSLWQKFLHHSSPTKTLVEKLGVKKVYLPWTADRQWQNFLFLKMRAAHTLLASMLPNLSASVRSRKWLGKLCYKSCS